ncbi:MAG: hypothetical protein ACM34L_09950 [Gemmatimonas sp.]|nr:hypothetical protein [Gemmatimonadaceae bacterium]
MCARREVWTIKAWPLRMVAWIDFPDIEDGATMATKKAPPWKRKRPKGPVKHLSSAEKARARARAKKAGRRYPNLVDNMAVAKKKPSRRAK